MMCGMAKKKAVKKAASKSSTKVAVKKKTAKSSASTSKKKSPAKKASATKIPVDEHCELSGKATVVDDWDAMLNQTNIGANNNKFYVIQLLQSGSKYYTWTRWGRAASSGSETPRSS